MESVYTITEKLMQIWNSIKWILTETFDIYPKYFFLFIITIISIIIFVNIILSKKSNVQKAIHIFGWFYIFLAAIIAAAAPQIFQNGVSMVPRNTGTIGGLVGILLIYLFSNYEISDIMTKIIITMSIILLIIQLISFNDIIDAHYSTNFVDATITEEIKEKIYKYEETTGKHVQYFVLYSDANKQPMYSGVRYYGDINVKAYANDWGTRGILELKLQREIINDTSNEEKYNKYKEHFETQDWNYFDIDEQIIIEDDTLYLCVF